MLTRKHFRDMATAVEAIEDKQRKIAVYVAFKILGEDSNPRFDGGLFWDACDMDSADLTEIEDAYADARQCQKAWRVEDTSSTMHGGANPTPQG